MKRLIYVAYSSIPSTKANSYQTFVMSHEFSKNVDYFKLILPKREKIINDPFIFYNLIKSDKFNISYISNYEVNYLAKISEFLWYNISRLFFSIKVFFELIQLKEPTVLYTRDPFILVTLFLSKKLNPKITKIFFEAHRPYLYFDLFMRLVDGIIVINNYNANYFNRLNKNLIVEYMGVDINRFKTLNYKNNIEFKKITYIGSFQKWKGIDTLINAFKFLDDKYKLILVGANNDQKKEILNFSKELGINNVEVIGFTSHNNLLDFFNNTDVLVLPNSSKFKENLSTSPIKLFEYMASKRLIIASNIKSIKEILNKNNAIFFKENDARDLANKIISLENTNTSIIVRKAFKDVQNYTWKKRSERILKFIYS